MLVAAVVAAVGLDVAVRLPYPSLAASLAVVAVTAMVVGARRATGRALALAEWLAVGLAVASGLALSWRASPWVQGQLVAAIGALVGLLATGTLNTDHDRPWLTSTRALTRAGHDTGPWLASGASRLGSGGRAGRWRGWARSAGAAAAAALVLTALLASGDAAFGSVVTSVNPVPAAGHLVVAGLAFGSVSAVALAALRSGPTPDRAPVNGPGRYGSEARAVLWAVAVVLAGWCAVQISLTVGDTDTALVERGITPASYARQGFFQLAAAAALSLTTVNVAHRLARHRFRPDGGQRLPVLVIGVALGALIGVAYSRLAYYVDAFGLTMLRLAVATSLGWVAIMTALSVARSLGVRHDRNWLPSPRY